MKFERKKVSALTGNTEVRFILDTVESDFSIIASPTGVSFRGNSPEFFDPVDIQELARTIGQAFTEHTKLKPRLSTNLAGH